MRQHQLTRAVAMIAVTLLVAFGLAAQANATPCTDKTVQSISVSVVDLYDMDNKFKREAKDDEIAPGITVRDCGLPGYVGVRIADEWLQIRRSDIVLQGEGGGLTAADDCYCPSDAQRTGNAGAPGAAGRPRCPRSRCDD